MSEMKKNDKEIWFPAMRYGVGWGFPITWQGWAVFLVYIALILLGCLIIRKSPFLIIPFVIYTFILSGILFYICWKKGEKPDIRWGKKL
jgi:lipoprotein signal peptidase